MGGDVTAKGGRDGATAAGLRGTSGTSRALVIRLFSTARTVTGNLSRSSQGG
jgi:hypothetical protein